MKHKPSPYLWSLIVVGDTGCVKGKNVRGKLSSEERCLDLACLQKGYNPSLRKMAQACALIARMWETWLLGRQRSEQSRARRAGEGTSAEDGFLTLSIYSHLSFYLLRLFHLSVIWRWH